MKKIVLMFVAAAAFIGTGGTGAAGEPTLSEYLKGCNENQRTCIEGLGNYLQTANSQGFICLPADQPLERAARQELNWLRTQADADDALRTGTAEDAQWAAITTLWPCKKDGATATE